MDLLLPETKYRNALIYGLLLTAILFASCILGVPYLNNVTGHSMSIPAILWISRLLQWLSVIVIYLYAIKKEGQPLLPWPEKKHSLLFYALSVTLLIIGTVIGGVIISNLVKMISPQKPGHTILNMVALSVPLKLVLVITAAVVEELIFRGYLLPRLQVLFKNKYLSILISALLFGLAHLASLNLINVLMPFYIGLLFAFHYQKYRNIKVLILCHFLIDFYELFLV